MIKVFEINKKLTRENNNQDKCINRNDHFEEIPNQDQKKVMRVSKNKLQNLTGIHPMGQEIK